MSSLRFSLKEAPKQRIDCSPLIPDTLAEKSLAEIAAMELVVGKSTIRVDALFELTDGDSNTIVFTNSDSKLDFVGRNMTQGSISVRGDVGAYLGIFLEGVDITVDGNTGIYTACEMAGGQIKVNGNAGDFLQPSAGNCTAQENCQQINCCEYWQASTRGRSAIKGTSLLGFKVEVSNG